MDLQSQVTSILNFEGDFLVEYDKIFDGKKEPKRKVVGPRKSLTQQRFYQNDGQNQLWLPKISYGMRKTQDDLLKNMKKDYTVGRKTKTRACKRLQAKLWPVVAKPIVVYSHKCLNVLSADSNLVGSHNMSALSQMAETGTVTNERMNKPPVPIKKVNINMSFGQVKANPRASVKLAPLHVASNSLEGGSLGQIVSPSALTLEDRYQRPRQLDPVEGYHEYVLLSPRVFNMFGMGRKKREMRDRVLRKLY